MSMNHAVYSHPVVTHMLLLLKVSYCCKVRSISRILTLTWFVELPFMVALPHFAMFACLPDIGAIESLHCCCLLTCHMGNSLAGHVTQAHGGSAVIVEI